MSRSQVLSKLSALVGSIDMSGAAGTVSMTMISGVGTGEFPSPIRYLGSVCYLALEISPISCHPVLRGYSAGIGNYPHEVLIGSRRFNTFAHDPSGNSRLCPPKSDAVGFAAYRMFKHSASGDNIILANNVVLPELLAQVSDDVLARGAGSPALCELGHQLRSQAASWPAFAAPAAGQVVEMRYDATNRERVVLCIETAASQMYEVVVPANATLTFPIADGAPAEFVTAGQPLVRHLDGVPDHVCEDFAWQSLIRTVKNPAGQEVRVVPFGYVASAIRRRAVQVEAIYEDVEVLLGPPIENPARIVLAGFSGGAEVLKDAAMRGQALARFRRELGTLSSFATPEDLATGLAYADSPLHLTGLAAVQQWRVSDEKSLCLARQDCFADFGGFKASWRGMLRDRDFAPALAMAISAADQVRGTEGYAEAALRILRQYPTLAAKTISRMSDMSQCGTEDKVVREFLVDLHMKAENADVSAGEAANAAVS
jgi:hypothetical protein